MKKALRVFTAILTSPVWVIGGACLFLASLPFMAMGLVLALMEFAITGEWKYTEIMEGSLT